MRARRLEMEEREGEARNVEKGGRRRRKEGERKGFYWLKNETLLRSGPVRCLAYV